MAVGNPKGYLRNDMQGTSSVLAATMKTVTTGLHPHSISCHQIWASLQEQRESHLQPDTAREVKLKSEPTILHDVLHINITVPHTFASHPPPVAIVVLLGIDDESSMSYVHQMEGCGDPFQHGLEQSDQSW